MVELEKIVALKLKGQSLVETLVATVLIVLIFGIASLTLNAIALNQMKNNTHQIEQELKKLQYNYEHGIISLPFFVTSGSWEIELSKEASNSSNYLIKAQHQKYSVQIVKSRPDVHR